MLDDRDLRAGMAVIISKDCPYSHSVGYEFWQDKKIRMMGTKKIISSIVPLGDRYKVVIDDWFFDSRDLTPIVSESDMERINSDLIEKNKIEKPKIYFNPEQL